MDIESNEGRSSQTRCNRRQRSKLVAKLTHNLFLDVLFQNVQEAAAPAATPAAPAPAATGDGDASATAAAAAEAATAAAAVVTATERAAADEAARLARRVERFGRIAPVTETEVAEKLAKRREKFGLSEPVGVCV